MTPEERADLQREEVRIAEAFAALQAERDAARADVERLTAERDLAESDGDSARRDLTGAYKVLIGVMPGSRPASTTAAAEKAAKVIRDHDAERRRVLAERDNARAEVERLRAKLADLRSELDHMQDADSEATVWHDEFQQANVERDRLAEQVKRVRARHSAQCGGACASTPCQCEPGDLVCAECETPHPCPTRIDLDGPEATP